MNDLDVSALRNSYERDRYVALPRILSDDVLDVVVPYTHILGSTDRFVSDRAVGASMSCYGEPGFDALLVSLLGLMTEVAGATVTPTYSYARVYLRGDELRRHRDRPVCEHSMTVHIDSSGGSWPVEFERTDGSVASFDLRPGDAVIYRGIELPHWRVPCPVDWYAQVFLHWVEVDGSNAEEGFDKRSSLGVPSVRGGRTLP